MQRKLTKSGFLIAFFVFLPQLALAHGQHPCGGPHQNDEGCGGGSGGSDPLGALQLTIGSTGGMSNDGDPLYTDGSENVKAQQGSDFANFETRKKKRGGARSIGLSFNEPIYVTNNSGEETYWNNNDLVDADVIIGRKRNPQADPSWFQAELTIRAVSSDGVHTLFVWFDDDTGPGFENCIKGSSDVQVTLTAPEVWDVAPAASGFACVRLQDNRDGAVSGAFQATVSTFAINLQAKP